MTSRLHHEDENIFPQPRQFKPDRWLQPESKSLKKYLSPFGHGTRICVGMQSVPSTNHLICVANL